MMAIPETEDKTAAKLKARINRWEAYVLQQQALEAPGSNALPSETHATAEAVEASSVSAPSPQSEETLGSISSAGNGANAVPPQAPVAGPIYSAEGDMIGSGSSKTAHNGWGPASVKAGSGQPKPKAVYSGRVTRIEPPRQQMPPVPQSFKISPLSTIDLGYEEPKKHLENSSNGLSIALYLTVLIAVIVGIAFLMMHA